MDRGFGGPSECEEFVRRHPLRGFEDVQFL